ncbi:sigma-70 family RNA polymerase sigma factor [Cumulibacter manganitolerans]|uniref:sigma-70 family RNA polymerase sigma factor n=1 Tax=Cumulibacter manganitolerans TaxID=1884992 RepID=UPI001E34DD41|nr:sigma-70 family RNA polymerase sigma factor [Cumulibacter manganitolerans]
MESVKTDVPRPGLPIQSESAPREERAAETKRLLIRAASAREPFRSRLRRQVVMININVANDVANRYRNRGVPLDDLRQVAYEGLLHAVLRFDVTKDRDLVSYAVPTMRGEVRRYFRDQGWTIRPPRRVQELQSEMTRALERLAHELGRPPTRAELCAETGASQQDLDETDLARSCYAPASLDQPAGQGPTLVGQYVRADDGPGRESEARLMLAPAVRRLGPRDKEILYLRFFEDLTQKEIGERLGVTQMQVSRVLTRILSELRTAITGDAA